MTHTIKIRSVLFKPRVNALALGCLLALASMMPPAQAADVAGMVGIAWGNHDIGGHVAWGAMGHLNLLPNVNIGAYYEHFSNDVTTFPSGTSFTNTYNVITADGNFLLTGILDGAYVGAKIGILVTSNSIPGTTNGTDLILGPAIGYDYPLGGGLSAGGQLNILFATSSPMLTNTNLLGVLRYTFP